MTVSGTGHRAFTPTSMSMTIDFSCLQQPWTVRIGMITDSVGTLIRLHYRYSTNTSTSYRYLHVHFQKYFYSASDVGLGGAAVGPGD